MHRFDPSVLPAPSPTRIVPGATAPPALPDSAQIRVGDRGYIHGIDGMLDQVAGALSRHAGPMIVRDVLPAVQKDHAMQIRFGTAVGQAVANEMQPWLILGAGALAVIATIQIVRWTKGR
jgi:hypothetical protein